MADPIFYISSLSDEEEKELLATRKVKVTRFNFADAKGELFNLGSHIARAVDIRPMENPTENGDLEFTFELVEEKPGAVSETLE